MRVLCYTDRNRQKSAGFPRFFDPSEEKKQEEMDKLKEKSRALTLFLAVWAAHSVFASLAHPITPTLIKNLGIGDYMFGVAFASMAFTNFLFSPFWGKISGYFGIGTLLFICCTGYAVGQFLFWQAASPGMIAAARMISGVFTGGINVLGFTYVADYAPADRQGKAIAIGSTLYLTFGSFGYLLGGLLGEISLNLVFLTQCVMLFLSGAGFFFLLYKKTTPAHKNASTNVRVLVKEANPFVSFLAIRSYLKPALILLFAAALFSNIGINAFDQCFNYYIKDQFGLSSAYNGLMKAIIGGVSFLTHFLICTAILKKTGVKKPLFYVCLLTGAFNVAMILMPSVLTFMAVTVLLFALMALAAPLLQTLVSKRSDGTNSGVIMGFFNAIKGLGMIAGALIAGFSYTVFPKLPFLIAAGMFFLAALLAAVYLGMTRGKDEVK